MTYAEAIKVLSNQGYIEVHTNGYDQDIVDHLNELEDGAYQAQVVMQFDGPEYTGPCRVVQVLDSGYLDTGEPLAIVYPAPQRYQIRVITDRNWITLFEAAGLEDSAEVFHEGIDLTPCEPSAVPDGHYPVTVPLAPGTTWERAQEIANAFRAAGAAGADAVEVEG